MKRHWHIKDYQIFHIITLSNTLLNGDLIHCGTHFLNGSALKSISDILSKGIHNNSICASSDTTL